MDKFECQISSGPSFQDFIKGVSVSKTHVADGEYSDKHSYLSEELEMGNSRKGQSPSLEAIKLNFTLIGTNAKLVLFVLMFQCILKPMDVK